MGSPTAFAAALRSFDDVRTATRQITNGRYDVRVAEPSERELAALATASMAATLEAVETRHVQLVGEVARLSRLADDLSAISRAESGQLRLEPLPCELRALASSALERHRPVAEAAGVRLVLEPGAEAWVEADPDRLSLVLRNLLANALRATPAGGHVKVTVTDASPATLTVTDSGEGIAASELERIFERFYRRRDRQPNEGSGIGLTISRAVMRAHDGDLVARSEGLGHGATFVASLPPWIPVGDVSPEGHPRRYRVSKAPCGVED